MNAGVLMMLFVIAIANIGGIYFTSTTKGKLRTKLASDASLFPPHARFCVRVGFFVYRVVSFLFTRVAWCSVPPHLRRTSNLLRFMVLIAVGAMPPTPF